MKVVYFLNMGGVNKLDECELFLKNMFNDENILDIKSAFLRKMISFFIRKSRIKQMKKNYIQIGSKSPLSDIQSSLCDKLNQMQSEYLFDYISTYVPPFAKDVLAKYQFSDDDEVILFPLYPHYSQTTVKSALNDFKKHYKALAKVKIVDVFYDDMDYNDLIIKQILAKQEEAKANVLILSAHSLPQKIINKGDAYEKHILKQFSLLKERLKYDFKYIELAYQSKLGPVKWLEPSISDVLTQYDKKGLSVLIYPLSFCIDCSETVFELAIEYKHQYKHKYNLCECLNDSDDFCAYILNKIKLL